MPAPDAIIRYGNVGTASTLVDEPNLLVESLVTTPTREKKTYKGGSRCTSGLEYVDPMMKFDFQARIVEAEGFADQHPGTQVTALANFAAEKFGFDPSVGLMVFEDPSLTQNNSDADSLKFTVMHYPFIDAA